MTQHFSVAMCTYNGASFLGEQLASIAAQTSSPGELVVCDDASTDATIEIVKHFASRATFPVRLSVNDQNLGSTRNFEKVISLCQGPLIALSDQDDVWLPQKLERLEAEFISRPQAGLVFSDAEIVDENLSSLGVRLWGQVGFDRRMQRRVDRGHALDVLLPGWTITGATMAFRSEFRDLVLPIPINLPMIHDGWIALVIAAVAEVALVPELLIQYRQHSQQQIGAPARSARARQPAVKSLDGIRAAMRSTNSYDQLIEIGERVQERLRDRYGSFNYHNALSSLNQRLRHLRVRARMPKNPLKRFPGVFQELIAGHYHHYSSGFLSAAKDLVYGDTAR